jgi:hypothetical protein
MGFVKSAKRANRRSLVGYRGRVFGEDNAVTARHVLNLRDHSVNVRALMLPLKSFGRFPLACMGLLILSVLVARPIVNHVQEVLARGETPEVFAEDRMPAAIAAG